MNEQLEASTNFYQSMSMRRSIRNFSRKKVSKKILINAIKTAATAPSGANKQPWHFAIVNKQEIKDEIRRAAEEVERDFYQRRASNIWLEDLKPFKTGPIKPYLSQASSLIVVFTRTEQSYYPIESTGIAVGFLLASLHQSGLATLTHTPKPMTFLNSKLGLDKTYRPYMIIVAGYAQKSIELPLITKKPLCEILSLH
ncbi:MAG: nitroreductase family protein [Halobacteriovorax sp.]|nr:nitroreductase family protein [Halobacteriovorax sp.]|tara:strand:- start:393 stop:986 length:594 start_codon:yes stop_codon:yes gene_type:complete